MKKFETLDEQERIANQQSTAFDKKTSSVSVKPKTLLLILISAVLIILILCLVLFSGKTGKNNVSAPPAPQSYPAAFGNSTSGGAIPYSGSTGSSAAMDMRTSEKVVPEVIKYEYCVSDGYLYYYVKLYNPSENNIIQFPGVRITARDANGILLGTQEMMFNALYPGQEGNYSDQAFAVDEKPTSVTIEALEPNEYTIISVNNASHKESIPLEVTGAAIRNDHVVGEVINHNEYDISMIRVSVVYRNSAGEMIKAGMDFPQGVPANGRTTFSVFSWGIDDLASVDVYAENWGF